eukprot:TRINITY_DN7891_c0_g1_i2.p1 TRINITY_DN7891_c0_g1~~TRINITY_DN7891_c0_g1_i2.p1  ORF type:complete len:146 (+),score=34.08 TRINITY_DN7891_c0_g1_i2:457-894(+)
MLALQSAQGCSQGGQGNYDCQRPYCNNPVLRSKYDCNDVHVRTRSALEVFEQALENVKPTIALTPVKKSGSIVQVPTPLTDKRRVSLAMKWIIKAARTRKSAKMGDALAAELLDAADNQGAAIRKRIEVHKMAEANRAFASMRWQ